MTAQNPHIIAICETWLDNNISNDELSQVTLLSVTAEPEIEVALLIATISFSVYSRHPTLELMFINLKLRHEALMCGLLYCPPSSDASILQTLESALEEHPPSTQNSLMLLGDFNIDYCQSAKTTHLHSLHSIEDKLSLKQIVTVPTRPASSTLIDHVYISERLSHSPCDIFYHLCLAPITPLFSFH